MNHLKTISKVAKQLAQFYQFDIYDKDDIYQEAMMAGLQVIDKWDGVRPLDKFLSFAIQNRLRNLIKSKVGGSTKTLKNKKSKLIETSDISLIPDSEVPMYSVDEGYIDQKMIFDKLDEEIPFEYRKDYLKLKLGQYVPKQKREQLVQMFRDILGYNEMSEESKTFLEELLETLP